MSNASDLTVPTAGRSAGPRFRVHLSCPTPLRASELLVEASSEAEAWAACCRHNGISDSDHPRTIERL